MNKFLKLIFLSVFFLASACELTEKLWNNSYEETFRQFLVSADGRYVVFLGDNYHYVFADDFSVITNLLIEDKKKLLFINSEKTYLKLDRHNEVKGFIVIETFDLELPWQDEEFLKSLGFKESEEGDLVLKLKVKGKRYLPNNDLNQYFSLLNESYSIPIHYEPGLLSKFEMVALTPITITLDTMLFLGEILLVPFRE